MKVENIVIVGGGTAGWLTAAYISHNFPAFKVTVIDKEVGNSIGVGEATLLQFKPFMDECGFNQAEWMLETNAGYKAAIMFTNWTEPGNNIWHPFFKTRKSINNLPIWELWTKNQDLDFKKYALSSYDVSVLHNSVDFETMGNYGYHVDCGKLVLYVQKKIKDKISIIRSEVVEVINTADDVIQHLKLKDGSIVSGDIFVDCTGFQQVLRKPKKRVDLMGRLFVNTAVVCQIPYQDKAEEFKPYAVCDATDHGWLWKIGVANRIGSGMIFNRHITDTDEAKDYFVKYWNNRIEKESVRVINWDPFYIEDQWSGNIVNIGLSAGFLEPLESTGIGLITSGVTQLANAIREGRYTDIDIEYYNLNFKLLYEDAVDFISAHYANNKRQTKFWNYVNDTFCPSDRMNYHLSELKRVEKPLPWDGRWTSFFGGINWSLLLIQLGYEVAPRNIDLPDDVCRELVIKSYITHEKSRHVWSRKHSEEIERIHSLKP
jgi:tryptophan halogenase